MIHEQNALLGAKIPAVMGRLTVAVAEDCTRFSLRLRTEDHAKAGRALGCTLPGRIGGLASSGDLMALCLGPDEWFLLMPSSSVEAIQDRFAAEIEGPYSLVDVSHREVGIEVRGSAATLALASACPLDLDAMPSGSCTRTLFDKAQIVLIKHAPDHYRIEVWQSFASHVWDLLAAVGREVSLDL